MGRMKTPWTGDKVFVHYVGTLTDGSKFDSSRDRGERFSFNLGKSEVIKGWDQGVATMKIGEKAMFTIKADYAYGSAGSPPKIPGYYPSSPMCSTFVFSYCRRCHSCV